MSHLGKDEIQYLAFKQVMKFALTKNDKCATIAI